MTVASLALSIVIELSDILSRASVKYFCFITVGQIAMLEALHM